MTLRSIRFKNNTTMTATYSDSLGDQAKMLLTEAPELIAVHLGLSIEAVFLLRRNAGIEDSIITPGTAKRALAGLSYQRQECKKCSSRAAIKYKGVGGVLYAYCTACSRASGAKTARKKDPHSKPVLPPEYRHKLNEPKEPDYWDSLENDL